MPQLSLRHQLACLRRFSRVPAESSVGFLQRLVLLVWAQTCWQIGRVTLLQAWLALYMEGLPTSEDRRIARDSYPATLQLKLVVQLQIKSAQAKLVIFLLTCVFMVIIDRVFPHNVWRYLTDMNSPPNETLERRYGYIRFPRTIFLIIVCLLLGLREFSSLDERYINPTTILCVGLYAVTALMDTFKAIRSVDDD